MKILAYIRDISIHPGVRDSISNPLTGVKGRRVISLTYPLSLCEYVEKTHFVGFRTAKLLISKDVARHDSTTTIIIKNRKLNYIYNIDVMDVDNVSVQVWLSQRL